MRLQVKTHHGQVTDSIRAYAEKRLSKLDKRLHDLTLVEVTLSQEHNPSISDDHCAEAVVYTKGPRIVARESAQTYEAAIDRLVDKLERQIERYRDKRTHEPRRNASRQKGGAQPVLAPEGVEPEPVPAETSTGEGEAA
jgi:putative sigma-54 modulation protein